MHKTIFETENDDFVYDYKYQDNLTSKLDELNGDFGQNIINEILLWKLNRYALVDDSTLCEINKIKKDDVSLNMELTSAILGKLLQTKGVGLAVASAILRFKNPNIYQIIDQRVYRVIYKKELKRYPAKIDEQIVLYLDYLNKLKEVCEKFNIPFRESDRYLYEWDKFHNSDFKLYNY